MELEQNVVQKIQIKYGGMDTGEKTREHGLKKKLNGHHPQDTAAGERTGLLERNHKGTEGDWNDWQIYGESMKMGELYQKEEFVTHKSGLK